MRDGLRQVHNALVGAGLRSKIKLGAFGKILSTFDIARCIALGADWCNPGRGFILLLAVFNRAIVTPMHVHWFGNSGPGASTRSSCVR